jgi:hypothetical protein
MEVPIRSLSGLARKFAHVRRVRTRLLLRGKRARVRASAQTTAFRPERARGRTGYGRLHLSERERGTSVDYLFVEGAADRQPSERSRFVGMLFEGLGPRQLSDFTDHVSRPRPERIVVEVALVVGIANLSDLDFNRQCRDVRSSAK